MELFKVIPTKEVALRLLDEIDRRLGLSFPSTYSAIYESLKQKEEVLVIYKEEILSTIEHSLGIYPIIDENKAIMDGFYIGVQVGRFPVLTNKVSELNFFYQSIRSHYGSVNNLLIKSLLSSFSSVTYSIKETLKHHIIFEKVTSRSQITPKEWWDSKNSEIHSKGELLLYFHHWFNNKYKHEGTLLLKSLAVFRFDSGAVLQARLNQFMSNANTVFGSDGVCALEQYGPERIFQYNLQNPILGLRQVEHYLEFVNVPNMHLGREIENLGFLDIISLVHDYYNNLVQEFVSTFQ